MAEMSLSEFNKREQQPPKRQIKLPISGLMAAGAFILIIGGFLAGVQYQKSKSPASSNVKTVSSQSGSNSGGPGGYGGGFRRGDRAIGTVSSVSSSSITIQRRNGSSSIYAITGGTTVTNNGQSASVSDIQSGDMVVLSLDSSNTNDVTSIMLNPSFGGGPGGYGSQSSPSSSGTSSNTSGV